MKNSDDSSAATQRASPETHYRCYLLRWSLSRAFTQLYEPRKSWLSTQPLKCLRENWFSSNPEEQSIEVPAPEGRPSLAQRFTTCGKTQIPTGFGKGTTSQAAEKVRLLNEKGRARVYSCR